MIKRIRANGSIARRSFLVFGALAPVSLKSSVATQSPRVPVFTHDRLNPSMEIAMGKSSENQTIYPKSYDYMSCGQCAFGDAEHLENCPVRKFWAKINAAQEGAQKAAKAGDREWERVFRK